MMSVAVVSVAVVSVAVVSVATVRVAVVSVAVALTAGRVLVAVALTAGRARVAVALTAGRVLVATVIVIVRGVAVVVPAAGTGHGDLSFAAHQSTPTVCPTRAGPGNARNMKRIRMLARRPSRGWAWPGPGLGWLSGRGSCPATAG